MKEKKKKDLREEAEEEIDLSEETNEIRGIPSTAVMDAEDEGEEL